MSAPEPTPFFHVSAITGDIKCPSAGRLLQLASGVTDPNVVDDAVKDLNAAVQRERQAAALDLLDALRPLLARIEALVFDPALDVDVVRARTAIAKVGAP